MKSKTLWAALFALTTSCSSGADSLNKVAEVPQDAANIVSILDSGVKEVSSKKDANIFDGGIEDTAVMYDGGIDAGNHECISGGTQTEDCFPEIPCKADRTRECIDGQWEEWGECPESQLERLIENNVDIQGRVFSPPEISGGKMVFVASNSFALEGRTHWVYLFDIETKTTRLIHEFPGQPGVNNWVYASISQAGIVYSNDIRSGGQAPLNELFKHDFTSGTTEKIMDTNVGTQPDIDDSGRIVFVDGTPGGQKQVFLRNQNGTVIQIAGNTPDNTGNTWYSYAFPVISDDTIAYFAVRSRGGTRVVAQSISSGNKQVRAGNVLGYGHFELSIDDNYVISSAYSTNQGITTRQGISLWNIMDGTTRLISPSMSENDSYHLGSMDNGRLVYVTITPADNTTNLVINLLNSGETTLIYSKSNPHYGFAVSRKGMDENNLVFMSEGILLCHLEGEYTID